MVEGMGRATRAALERMAAEPLLERTLAWAAINSGTDNLPGLATQAARLADAFSGLPGTLALVPADPVESVSATGEIVTVARGAHLHLRVRPDAPVQVLLTGHMDTVYPADSPFQTCRIRADGLVNGPGVADMKGGLSVMLAALTGLETSPLAARIGYELVINSDEETGSQGSAALLRSAARGKCASLTFEPATRPDGTLAGARPGSGNLALVVRGRSAHAGRNPEDGRNALVAAADCALRLARAAAPGLSINPARIDGGGPTNVVPDRAVLRVNLRPATPARQAEAEALLAATIADVAAAHQVSITCHGGFARPPKPLDAGAERLLALVRACGAALGQEIGWAPSGGVCDGNIIAACGVPVVDTLGVRGGAIHSEEEYLIPASLSERARLTGLILLSLAERGLA
ncbi:hydrolase [Sphingomonas morindae]|uniref:Hydrolase n=1 Tax=Sphingomonas morindae TaxID=1541170 RepID=A0ABY4X5J3_9SPHN|nr:hydrolase [Sphingomonas morindae]USI72160.1 hydrolase [Sphingomonas morindae]